MAETIIYIEPDDARLPKAPEGTKYYYSCSWTVNQVHILRGSGVMIITDIDGKFIAHGYKEVKVTLQRPAAVHVWCLLSDADEVTIPMSYPSGLISK